MKLISQQNFVVEQENNDEFEKNISIEKDSNKEELTVDRRDIDISPRSTDEDKNKPANHSASSREPRDHEYTRRQIKMRDLKSDSFDVELSRSNSGRTP